jgi:hypothetical protein
VESRFDPEKTGSAVRQVLGDARNVTFTPMSLRSIFLAMAKNQLSTSKPGAES